MIALFLIVGLLLIYLAATGKLGAIIQVIFAR